MEKARLHYNKAMHINKGPPSASRPIPEQLIALNALLKEKAAPYTDFAYWGPHGSRTLHKLSSSGLASGPDKQWVGQGFRGPPSIEHWSDCFEGFHTAMIMLEAASPPVLLAYRKYIESLAHLFGPVCWVVIYHAEKTSEGSDWRS